jgi:predicted nucleic acid-binding protein
LPVTTDAAAYGAIPGRVEATGQTIGQNDLWIAAQALALGAYR